MSLLKQKNKLVVEKKPRKKYEVDLNLKRFKPNPPQDSFKFSMKEPTQTIGHMDPKTGKLVPNIIERFDQEKK